MGTEAAAIGGLIVAIAGTSASMVQQKKQASAAKKASRAQREQEQLARQAEARERYRTMRAKRAQQIQTAEYLGAADSTSAQAGINTVGTAYNIGQGFANRSGFLADAISIYSSQEAQAGYRAGMYQSIANIGFAAANLKGGGGEDGLNLEVGEALGGAAGESAGASFIEGLGLGG